LKPPTLAQHYGITVQDGTSDATIELMMAFNARLAAASGFLGRYQHLRNAIDLLWNEPRRREAVRRGQQANYDVRIHDAYIWNDWSELMMETFMEWHWATTVWAGNASWKTTSGALYALNAWYASPADTVIVLTSTTLPGLRKRIWKEVVKFYRLCPAFGHMHASDFAIRLQKGSDESGIFGIATGQDDGDVQKAVDKIIGFHATNVIAIVDEMQATNEAIVKACASLEAGAQRFQFIGLGNPDNELDALGQMSEPVGGWSSITPEFERWETQRGVCIHLDGLESPRVKEGDQYYPGLLKASDIESVRKAYGEDSPEFWRTRRGFIAPQGVTKTVLTPADVNQFRAKEKAIWAGRFKLGAGLDPAFEGGDRCTLRFGREGEFDDGITGLELTETVIIKVKASDPLPIHYQIAHAVKAECEQRNVPPDMFGMDTTGEGGGLASIIMQEWSRAILHVEFGGKASDSPISPDDKKPAREEYLNRVSELWFWFRVLVRRGMVRGLDADTMREFCQRRWEMRGLLKMVEPKSQMKVRTKRSPDLADGAVVLAEVFRKRGNLSVATSGGSNEDLREQWTKLARRLNNVDSGYLVEA